MNILAERGVDNRLGPRNETGVAATQHRLSAPALANTHATAGTASSSSMSLARFVMISDGERLTFVCHTCDHPIASAQPTFQPECYRPESTAVSNCSIRAAASSNPLASVYQMISGNTACRNFETAFRLSSRAITITGLHTA